MKCGVSVNKIVGGDSGKLIEVEHSTVTIKTDAEQKDVKHLVNGLKDEEAAGSYRLRRKSTTDPPPKILKTKAVKRKRQSGAETETDDRPDNNNKENSVSKKLPVTLEITPCSKSSTSSTSSVESHQSSEKPPVKAVNENHFDDEEDEDNDVVMVELDEEFVVEKVDSKAECHGCSDSSPSQEEGGAVEVCGEEKSKPVHR